MILTHDWEFNILGVYNYHKPGRLYHYMDFIRAYHGDIEGDICEAGVYKGKSLLATALLLKELGSDKRVIGFDNFAGLPPAHPKDGIEMFDVLLDEGRISKEHYEQVARFWAFRKFVLGKEPTLHTVSAYAGDMADVSLGGLLEKIDFLELDNIEFHIGPFDRVMMGDSAPPYKFMAALLDCDLYESYQIALPYVWDRLSWSGLVYFDEYYSLKFPGARLACDEFFAEKADKPMCLSAASRDFERWGARKLHG